MTKDDRIEDIAGYTDEELELAEAFWASRIGKETTALQRHTFLCLYKAQKEACDLQAKMRKMRKLCTF